MNLKIKKTISQFSIVLFVLSMLLCCNLGKGRQPLSLEKLKHTSSAVLADAYRNYLKHLNLSTSAFEASGAGSMLDIESGFKQDLNQDPNLLYFPPTLWQMYAVTRDKKWEALAEKLENLIVQNDAVDSSVDPDAYLTMLYHAYLHSRNLKSLTLLLKALSEIISPAENAFSLDSLPRLSEKMAMEKLLINEVLFFASRETGDPVYRNFALQNSELVYNNFFLADSLMVGEGSLLQVSEIRKLAIGFYGFSYLFKETGMEKYQTLSHRLADEFIRIFSHAENDSGKETEGCINSEKDLVTQALVAVTLFDLGEMPENSYREASSQIFQHILAALSQDSNATEPQSSFVLFYYLFEYEKRLHVLDKRGVLAINSHDTI